MKISLTKKMKVASIENIHEKERSPYKDWLIIIAVFCFIILSSALVSSILFYQVLGDDALEKDTKNLTTSQQYINIDVAKLGNATDFINSRSGKISTSTNK